MTTVQTNRKPQVGDFVRTWDYRKHEHRQELTEKVSSDEGEAVNGGYYVYLQSGPVVAVEKYPEQEGDTFIWVEKHPRVEQRHDA